MDDDESVKQDGGKASEVHEWSAFYDDEGRIYYYNSVNGESSWDAPEKYNPPPDADEKKMDGNSREEDAADTATAAVTSVDDSQSQETEEARRAWVAYRDDEGREYYYNTVTQQTTWDKPEGLQEEGTLKDNDKTETDGSSPKRAASPLPMEEEPVTPEDKQPDATDKHLEEQADEPEIIIDPAAKRLEDAQSALRQTDAILELGVMSHVTEVVTNEGGNPQHAIQALSESYFGETAACGLMGKWLADLKSQAATNDLTDQAEKFSHAADEIRETAQGVVNRISKERFTKTGGDSILDLSKSEAAFLTKMMDSNRWRKLLIDLSASNKDSALLMYCLEQISKRGHHREIARRINQSDHFTVFNAMLASELIVIGKIAVSTCRGSDTAIGLGELVGDLQRTCTSTAYTYIYAIEVLRHLVATAKERSMAGSSSSSLYSRAIRKWERLSEDLQGAMVDPASAGSSTPLFRKRRLDVAVTISELHQRQRRRFEPSHGSEPNGGKDDDDTAKVETAVLNFLRRYSLGTQINDQTLDAMLPDGLRGDPTNHVGRLLLKRPLTIKALLGYMFKPGSQRISSIVIKNKCARLISLAVRYVEEGAIERAKSIHQSSSSEFDEVSLVRMLSQGSQLCETLENMVSFIVTSGSEKNGAVSTPGERLCSLALSCPPVAQGVAIWAREVTKGSDFVSSASYPTLSPSILSLVRVLYLTHPFIRDDAMEVAFCFLQHSNSEISYQKINEIKEQSLRLLLFLCAKGEAPGVLGRLTTLLNQSGSSFLDASLIRYFVSGLLEVASVPYSIPFVRLLCGLLRSRVTLEAVKTRYFDEKSKGRLKKVIKYLSDLQTKGTQGKLTPQDVLMVKAVISSYNA